MKSVLQRLRVGPRAAESCVECATVCDHACRARARRDRERERAIEAHAAWR